MYQSRKYHERQRPSSRQQKIIENNQNALILHTATLITVNNPNDYMKPDVSVRIKSTDDLKLENV